MFNRSSFCWLHFQVFLQVASNTFFARSSGVIIKGGTNLPKKDTSWFIFSFQVLLLIVWNLATTQVPGESECNRCSSGNSDRLMMSISNNRKPSVSSHDLVFVIDREDRPGRPA